MASPRKIIEIFRKEMSSQTSLAKITNEDLEEIKKYFKEVTEKIEKLKKLSNPMIEKEIERLEEEIRNMKRVVEKIFIQRFRKGIYLALMASESHPNMLPTENMIEDEKRLFKEIAEKLYRIRRMIIDEIVGKGKEIKKESSNLLVRILEDIEEFVWEDGKIYGPFLRGDLVKLPREVAEMLRERRKAEVVA